MEEQAWQHFRMHLEKFVSVTDADFEAITGFLGVRRVGKKENLLEEGQACKAQYFVIKGCLRLFFLNDKGTEQTTQFAIENWWLTDSIAFERGLPASFSVQAVEPSVVLVLTSSDMEAMLRDFPFLEKYFRIIFHKAYAASQFRVRYIFDFSKEAFYLHFLKAHPGFAQRVPQYLLASFLGLTPEYLSEIRKKHVS
jgi:CRP-like cAMP-binding protein